MISVVHKEILKYLNAEIVHKFEERYEHGGKEECWEYHHSKNKWGYGSFHITIRPKKYMKLQAHRLAWVIYHKKDIPDDLHICHKCDNPCCVNPFHLDAATYQENHRQKTERKRVNYEASRGERNTQAKLTSEEVLHIYSMKGRYSQRDIGRIYGITHATVGSIHLKKQWKHILADLP